MVAVTYVAARPITIAAHAYNAGDTIDTTGWAANTISVMMRLGWLAIETGGGPETDPVASPLVTSETSRAEAAEAALQGLINGLPTQESGTLANLPANGSRPNGSTYTATDQYGGTTYRMSAGVWVQQAAGVTQASGQVIAGPVQLASQFDVKAVNNVMTDVTGMSLAVPASSRPVLLKAKFEVQMNTGTAAVASVVRILTVITDNNNVIVGTAGKFTAIQVTAAAVIWAGQISLEAWLPAPVTATTYKIRAQLDSAIVANWTSALLLPGNGAAPAAVDNFYAVTA